MGLDSDFQIHLVGEGFDADGEQKCLRCRKVLNRQEKVDAPGQNAFPAGRVIEFGDVAAGEKYRLISFDALMEPWWDCETESGG